MNDRTEHPSEILQRFSRRNLFVLLVIVLLLGATGIAITLSPQGAIARSSERFAWFIPVAFAIIAGVQTSLARRRWDPKSEEVKLILDDEWRRTNMARASRAALVTVLVAQTPLAWTFGFLTQLPPVRLAFAMALSTITLGLTTLIALFLIFDRD
ncbi:MAG TPA: hypothetical protein VGQ36_03050 [Thermoanaerobaculia bacterium]|jgi:hypothetical protein|nr:hypothetical protein [Thermoanaerobaculia bacterium]